MTDRELLELAAKAAGCKKVNAGKSGAIWRINGRDWPWDALNDDWDAEQLKVKFGMRVSHHPQSVGVQVGSNSECIEWLTEFCWQDLSEKDKRKVATRRAITRAAAEIGRNMP